jgi:hypothetical protein
MSSGVTSDSLKMTKLVRRYPSPLPRRCSFHLLPLMFVQPAFYPHLFYPRVDVILIVMLKVALQQRFLRGDCSDTHAPSGKVIVHNA